MTPRIRPAAAEGPLDAGAVTRRAGAPPPAEPVVRVSIGRVELRAVAPPPPAPTPASRPRPAPLSLAAYLAQREGGGR